MKYIDNNLCDKGIKEVCEYLSYVTTLQILSLANNNLTNNGLTVLSSHLSSLPKLKALHLQNNLLGPQVDPTYTNYLCIYIYYYYYCCCCYILI